MTTTSKTQDIISKDKISKFKVKIKIKDHVTCKDCVYLFHEKLNRGKYCNERGIIETSKACPAYKPNVHKLRSCCGNKEVINLIEAIREIPTDLLPILASLLAREGKTRVHTKYKFLQRVVISYTGTGEYLSDYCQAYVLDADKEYIRFINRGGTFIAQFPIVSTSIYTMLEFYELRKDLIDKGKKVRPKIDPRPAIFDETIPTIDTVREEKRIPKSRFQKVDLHTLFTEIMNF